MHIFLNTNLLLFLSLPYFSLPSISVTHLANILFTLCYKARTNTHTHREMFPFGRPTQTVPDTHTPPPQHQRESVMSVVEGVDTAPSTNMLISYATETLHPSAVLEMGHNTDCNNRNSHDGNTLVHSHVHINNVGV